MRLRQPDLSVPRTTTTRRWIWKLPFAWFVEEAFWRDVVKSATSTGLVALIVYVYALGAGYVSSPTGSQTLRGIWNVATTAVVGLAIGTAMLWGPWLLNSERFEPRPKWVQLAVKIFTWVTAVFIGLATFHIMTGFFNDVRWAWPFSTPFWHIPTTDEPH